jgi:type I restriction enzyme S subunit
MSWEKINIRKVIFPPISGEWGEVGNEINVLRTTNFSNDGSLDLSDVVKRRIPLHKVEGKRLKFGDTILEKSGGSPSQPVGRVVYFNLNNGEPYLCNNFTSIIRPQANIDSKYLFWFLFFNHVSKKTLSYQNKTTGILNLKTERYLDDLEIPLPPLSVQKKVATILDKADELRKKDYQLSLKYDELLKSIFYNMFGDPTKYDKKWEAKRVNEILKDIVAGSSYGGEERELLQDELGVLKVSAVTWGYFKNDEYKAVKKAEIRKEIISPRKGDLLFSRANTRELVGATCVVDDDYPHLFLPDKIWRVDLDLNKCNQYYFKSLLSDNLFRTNLTKTATGTSGSMLNISMEKFRALEIPVPPITLQNKFSSIAQNMQEQKKLIKQQMEQSENLFQGLLQRAFKGDLVKE